MSQLMALALFLLFSGAKEALHDDRHDVRILFYFIYFIPIYCLLGPCPMSDVTCCVSTIASLVYFVELYICFEWLGLKHISSRMCGGVTQLLGGPGQVCLLVCGRFLLGWQVEVCACMVESVSGTYIMK